MEPRKSKNNFKKFQNKDKKVFSTKRKFILYLSGRTNLYILKEETNLYIKKKEIFIY